MTKEKMCISFFYDAYGISGKRDWNENHNAGACILKKQE